MRVQHVAIAIAFAVWLAHVPGMANETPPPLESGVQLAKLTRAVGEAASLPKAYTAVGRQILQPYSTEGLAESLSEGEELVRAWLRETPEPEQAPWVQKLTDVQQAIGDSQEQLRALPPESLSSLAGEQLAPAMDALQALGDAIESLDEALYELLPSDTARWEFQIAFLCRSLADELPLPPSLTKEDVRFLAESIPAELSQSARRSVEELLETLPERAEQGPVLWTGQQQRDKVARLARSILVELGVEQK